MAPLDPNSRSPPSIPKCFKRFSTKETSDISNSNGITEETNIISTDGFQIYLDFPLVQSMLTHEKRRNKYFEKATKKQREYPRSTDGWIKTIFIIKGRALDRIMLPWAIVTLNAVLWSIVLYFVDLPAFQENYDRWQQMYSIVANSTLAFLLVFRLYRVAMRFWETRTMWGKILVVTRGLVSSILIHGDHAPEHRDRAIAYIAAFAVATKHYIRGEIIYPDDELAGILDRDELNRLEISPHSALYASNKIRQQLKQVFMISTNTPVQLAAAWSIQMQLMEQNINDLLEQLGGMEKVRTTPLPLVYVAQLRTVLLLYLLTLPFVWVNYWGWSTVVVISLTAFALLGVEAAASECEIPFDKNRTNHLELDSYCYMVVKSIQQLVKDHADLQIQTMNEANTSEEAMEAGNGRLTPSEIDNLVNAISPPRFDANYREPWNGYNDQVSILVDEYPPITEPDDRRHDRIRTLDFTSMKPWSRRRFLT